LEVGGGSQSIVIEYGILIGTIFLWGHH
jgi:hypothetical protein